MQYPIKSITVTALLACIFTIAKAQMPYDTCINGMAGNYPCHNIDLLKSINKSFFLPAAIPYPSGHIYNPSNDKGNDIWGWTDESSGREFVISGRKSGTSFIEITDPFNPIFIGYLFGGDKNMETLNIWRDIKTYKNFAYIVSEDYRNGLQIFDLNRLLPVQNLPQIFIADTLVKIDQLGFYPGSAHNVVCSPGSDYIYIVGGQANNCNGGLEYFNVSDPLNPIYEGCFNAEGYTHDAVCFIYQGPDREHIGKEICVASNERFQMILDISDKTDGTMLSKTSYPNTKYTHQGWVSDDHRFIFFNDELDETRLSQNTRTHIMNIENLDSSYYLGYHEFSTTATDHNCYVKGQYLYESNYESGLRILDIENISNFPDSSLSEVAYFETATSAWSIYPYFKSGTIAINTIEGDLVLVRPLLPHFIFDINDSPLDFCQGDTIKFTIDLNSYYGYNDMVNLSTTGIPVKSIASFENPTVPSDGQAVLSLTSNVLIEGNYSLTLIGRGVNEESFHEISLSFRLVSIPNHMTLQDTSISGNQVLKSTDSFTLDNVIVEPLKSLTIYSPNISIQNQLTINPTGSIHLINEKNCSSN